MKMYEKVMELIEDAKGEGMRYDYYLEKLSLLLAEELDEVREEMTALKDRLANYE